MCLYISIPFYHCKSLFLPLCPYATFYIIACSLNFFLLSFWGPHHSISKQISRSPSLLRLFTLSSYIYFAICLSFIIWPSHINIFFHIGQSLVFSVCTHSTFLTILPLPHTYFSIFIAISHFHLVEACSYRLIFPLFATDIYSLQHNTHYISTNIHTVFLPVFF